MDIREYKPIIYLVILAASLIFMVITMNDLIFLNGSFRDAGLSLLSLGNWEYWIFAVSFVLTLLFGYMFFTILRDARKFYAIVENGNKLSLSKNLREMQEIAKKLGSNYEKKLAEATKRWNVR
ncbi:MAG: DUF3198 domain-containing protein [Candidatus Thermoplasmatota archaeon]|nr:DUF3198 domain-containing protein [Candidatus Thermoplasmatota archaeon]MCL5800659.1 DUF3198 domain-containing protein [Candidatus Thermoplasmatota archaeon]